MPNVSEAIHTQTGGRWDKSRLTVADIIKQNQSRFGFTDEKSCNEAGIRSNRKPQRNSGE
ncbi:hypothetical protein PRVXH_002491 [Proteinivorax hydrogeniformans]|uniref:Uncharacterized protein n=1 Tax=Proteinivorax hydrogeniformans TaxID=1826727 RepID=A0AAU8HT76_9FIRM